MADTTVNRSTIKPLQGALRIPGTAGANTNVGDAGYLKSDGTIVSADANVNATVVEAVGIIVESFDGETAIVSGDALTWVAFGPVTGFSDLTPGARVFVSINVGRIADAAPSGAGTWTKCIGYVLNATTIFVLPGLAAATSNT